MIPIETFVAIGDNAPLLGEKVHLFSQRNAIVKLPLRYDVLLNSRYVMEKKNEIDCEVPLLVYTILFHQAGTIQWTIRVNHVLGLPEECQRE